MECVINSQLQSCLTSSLNPALPNALRRAQDADLHVATQLTWASGAVWRLASLPRQGPSRLPCLSGRRPRRLRRRWSTRRPVGLDDRRRRCWAWVDERRDVRMLFAGASTSNYRLPGFGLRSRKQRHSGWELGTTPQSTVQAGVDSSHAPTRLQTWRTMPHPARGRGPWAAPCWKRRAAEISGFVSRNRRPALDAPTARPSSSLAFGLLPLPASGPGMASATWDSPGSPGETHCWNGLGRIATTMIIVMSGHVMDASQTDTAHSLHFAPAQVRFCLATVPRDEGHAFRPFV
jgi:hypothetical protein